MTHTCSRPNLQALHKIVLNIVTTRLSAGFSTLFLLAHSKPRSRGLKNDITCQDDVQSRLQNIRKGQITTS